MTVVSTDLRIDNVVKYFDNYVKIRSIYDRFVNIEVDSENKIVSRIPVQELEPIKINSDALAKMGFNRHPQKDNECIYKEVKG